ncbi:MAG: CBS domain-containing protein [Bacillota bacterium]
MQVITTHVGTDFDGLGAMLAAGKLYPDASLFFPGHLSRSVQEFYSLHKDFLPIKAPEMLHLGTVSELIVVDTAQAKRLGRFQQLIGRPGVRAIVYDHHPQADSPIQDAMVHNHQVGAVTSHLVQQLSQQSIGLTPLEATVMALGIYADTACLTTPNTTVTDVQAVGYLLGQGADLQVVAKYVNNPLNLGQRRLLEEMLANTERHSFSGVKVLLTVCSIDEYIDGLGLLAERLAELEDADVVFCLVQMDQRVHLVGRSRHNHLPINELVAVFGGGGHPQAAAATIKGRPLSELKEELIVVLSEQLQPPLTAKDLMSSPVHTIEPETSMQAAGEAMLRYGHSGLPVVENGIVRGVVSRRDVDKSIRHGLQHAPVKAFMTSKVWTISPDATLDDVQRLLIGRDIGRLPVVDGEGQLLGIVTRTDVLKALHGRSYPHWYQSNFRQTLPERAKTLQKLTDLMAEQLPKRLQGILLLIGQEADRQGVRAYLVGGLVRDLLLGLPNLDVDIVIEPEAIPFAEHLAKVLSAELRTYPKFNTATLTFPGGLSCDLVTARTEFYAYPAALPDVEQSTIKQDLYRRDFTINTMAIALNGRRHGELLDFFGGRDDLAAGAVRVLFNLSFVEDPTRILRAVRFEQRYGFTIEPETMRFLQNALENDLLHKVGAERLHHELWNIFQEEQAVRMLLRMDELGIWKDILPELQFSDQLIKQLKEADQHCQWFTSLGAEQSLDRSLVYLLLIANHLPPAAVQTLPERLALSKRDREQVLMFKQTLSSLASELEQSLEKHQVYQLLQEMQPECQVAAAVLYGSQVRQQMALYYGELLKLNVETDGHDLLGLGLKPGPAVGAILKQLRNARLNGLVQNKSEELALARQLLATPESERG